MTALLTSRAAAASGSHPAVTFVVTIFMSTQDEVGDIYPRIEFAQDNFGHSIDHLTVEPGGGVNPEEAGGSDRPAIAAGKGADEGKMFRNFEGTPQGDAATAKVGGF